MFGNYVYEIVDNSTAEIIMSLAGDTPSNAPATVFGYNVQTRNIDIDGNGVMNINDLKALVQIILGNDSNEYNHTAADVNKDSSITLSDITQFVNTIFGLNIQILP